MISFTQFSFGGKKSLAFLYITLFAFLSTHLHAGTNPPSLPTQFLFTAGSEKFEFKKSSYNFNSAQSKNATKESRFSDIYLRVSRGLGKGRSEISPDDERIYINDSGVALGLRLALEKPLMSMVSVHGAWDGLFVIHPRFFENSTGSMGMSLSTGFSIGRRDVPGNFHVTASVGYGLVRIGDDGDDEDPTCLTLLCGKSKQGGSSGGAAYRLSVGYTMKKGTLIELVGQRIGGEGFGLPDDVEAHLHSTMIMISNKLDTKRVK